MALIGTTQVTGQACLQFGFGAKAQPDVPGQFSLDPATVNRSHPLVIFVRPGLKVLPVHFHMEVARPVGQQSALPGR